MMPLRIIVATHFWKSYQTQKQVSAYEACDRTLTPLSTPKILGTSEKKHAFLDSKSFKVCGRSHVNAFFFHFLYNTKILRENHVYLFVVRLVQWWKLYYIYIFFTQRTTDFHRLKRNMNDETIIFLTSLLIPLTWNILFFFSQKQLPGSVL